MGVCVCDFLVRGGEVLFEGADAGFVAVTLCLEDVEEVGGLLLLVVCVCVGVCVWRRGDLGGGVEELLHVDFQGGRW